MLRFNESYSELIDADVAGADEGTDVDADSLKTGIY